MLQLPDETVEHRAMREDIAQLEDALRDSEARNSSLEALVLSLMSEAERQEDRRSRERRLRRASSSGMVAPIETIDNAREMLEAGSQALVAAHEHTLRLVEMRIAAMSEQLTRCSSALPASAREPSLTVRTRSPTSPSSPSPFPKWATYEADEDWAEPTSGGICLDSLPLHVPSAGDLGVTGGAFGIHGRRPAIFTTPWSANPARLIEAWWSEMASSRDAALTVRLSDDLGTGADPADESSAPPSPHALEAETPAPGAAAVTFMADADQAAVVLTPKGPRGVGAQQTLPSPSSIQTSPSRGSLVASARQYWTGRRQTGSDKRGVADQLDAPREAVDERLHGALLGWASGSSIITTEAPDAWGSLLAVLDEDSGAARGHASPWSLVTHTLSEALTLTPRRHANHNKPRLSVAGQHALSGALQVAIARHPILATMPPDLRRDVAAGCMRELRVSAGAVVAAQGADCDAFAVVGSGVFEGYIAESGPMPVREYKRGDAFGDLGLVCSCKHAITVRCREPGTLWLLERAGFHSALLATTQRRAASACTALKRVATLSSLSDAQLALLANALQEVALPPGAPLLRRGEAWDALYIVCAGTLEDRYFQANKKVKVKGLGDTRVRTLRPGEHIGEDSLSQLGRVACASGRRAGATAAVGSSDSSSSVSAAVIETASALPLSTNAYSGHTCRVDSSKPTPSTVLPTAAVCAGEDGCCLLRLPASALVEALSSTSHFVCIRDIESRATAIFAKLVEAEPSLSPSFTSPGQREQLLSTLEVVRPAPGTELQRRGEPSDGIWLLESGTLLKGTPWGASSSRRSSVHGSAPLGVGGVCGAGIVGVRRGGLTNQTDSSESPQAASGEEAPVQAGTAIGTLGAGPSPTSLFAHVGVMAYRLPRRAALVILASTHEMCKGRLTPRATPYHLSRPPPPPPPFASLAVAALLGDGGTSRVLLVRKKAGVELPSSPSRLSLRDSGADTGSSAVVSATRARDEFALKILKRGADMGKGPSTSMPNGLQAARERHALAACNHQFVPRLEGASDGFLLMEAVRGCELFYLLREVHRFEAGTATFYAAMVLSALVHLHSLALVHRDVKPENLVLDAEGYLRLVDLGLCRQLSHPAERAYTLCGTPEYTAPEVLRGTGHGKEVDSWALGVLLFELLAGYPAFCADEPIKVYALVLKAHPAVPRSFPRRAKELISLLLRPQPHTRLGAMRGGSVDVACHSFFDPIDWMALLSRQLEAPLIPVVALDEVAQNGLRPSDVEIVARAAREAA